MFSIGLTGGIGSGKTTVADLFAAHGVPVIDTDLIAHQITAPGGVAMPLIASAVRAGVRRRRRLAEPREDARTRFRR